MALPDNFKCVVTNWDYIYNLCRNVADDVKEDGYEPDIIIALARGGWFAGRVLCDFLNPFGGLGTGTGNFSYPH